MELRDYTRALRRHWIAIIVMTAIGVAVGWGWAAVQTPVYKANASGVIQYNVPADTAMSPGQADSLAKSKVPTYLEMATWRPVAEHAADELGVDTPPEELVGRITVENPQGTAILKVTADGETPEEARDLAAAWVNGMIVEIDETEGNGEPGSAPYTIQLVESAALPTSPAFPDVRTAMLVGAVLGLGGGIAFAMMRAISDRRIRPTDDIEQRIGIPVVGALPDTPRLADGHRLYRRDEAPAAAGRASRADFAIRESLRMLRTNLQFMDVDNPPRTIVVSSAMPGEGKSTMAVNLASALAAAGQQVVLVDGDLRRPTVAATMGITADVGLTDVLAGRVELVDVLHRVPGMSRLVVLGAGTLPHNPSELLGSERMHKALADLSEHAVVIVDAPPLLSVTDAAVLTHQADGALIVASVGKTTYDLVDKAVDALDKIHGRVLGIVLNRVPLDGGSGVYAYAYESRAEARAGGAPAAGGAAASGAPAGGAPAGVAPVATDVGAAAGAAASSASAAAGAAAPTPTATAEEGPVATDAGASVGGRAAGTDSATAAAPVATAGSPAAPVAPVATADAAPGATDAAASAAADDAGAASVTSVPIASAPITSVPKSAASQASAVSAFAPPVEADVATSPAQTPDPVTPVPHDPGAALTAQEAEQASTAPSEASDEKQSKTWASVTRRVRKRPAEAPHDLDTASGDEEDDEVTEFLRAATVEVNPSRGDGADR